MAKQQSDLIWTTIDPTSLPEEDQINYAAYKDAYRIMKALRDKFETGINRAPPTGKRIVAGYNFGKLSLALAPDDQKAKVGKPVQSLSAFLAAQVAGGRQ